MKRFRLGLLAGIAVALSSVPALAEAKPPTQAPDRSVWVGATYQFLLTDAFEPSSRHGFGVSLGYEFGISPKFDLGLAIAYRLYPGSTATHQLGYGAILKDFFSRDWATADGVFPFIDYGLLLQQSFVQGRRGSATSHDTLLGFGTVIRTSGISFFVAAAGHYSRLGYFDMESKSIPYVEGQLGWVYAY